MNCIGLAGTIATSIAAFAAFATAVAAFKALRSSNKQAQFDMRVRIWLATKHLAEHCISHKADFAVYLQEVKNLREAWDSTSISGLEKTVASLREVIEYDAENTSPYAGCDRLEVMSYSAQLLFKKKESKVMASFLDAYRMFSIDMIRYLNSRLNSAGGRERIKMELVIFQENAAGMKDAFALLRDMDNAIQMANDICSDRFSRAIDKEIRIG